MQFVNKSSKNMITLKGIMEKEGYSIREEPTTVALRSEDGNKTNLAASNVGLPLRASSPALGMDGDGDGHSLRSVHNLLSPIRMPERTFPGIKPFETPPPSAPVSLDTFLPKVCDGEETSNEQQSSLPKDLCLPEGLDNMSEKEVRNLLGKMVIENMGLRQELRTKEKRICAYKGQMLAILDWKVRQATESDGEYAVNELKAKKSCIIPTEKTESKESSQTEFDVNMIPHKTMMHDVQEITMVDEVFSVRRSLSFIQELASSIDVDQDLLRHRFKDGCYLTNQLLLGGIAGWLSALFVKKFGKIALSAAGGGLLILVYTAKKGYVNVNYDSIYQEISQLCDTVDNEHQRENSGLNDSKECVNNSDWEGDSDSDAGQELGSKTVVDRLKNAKKWVTSHSYTVGGFALSFIYNII